MIHRGEILEKAVRASNVSITYISKALEKDRTTLYNWFENPNLPYDILLKVGKIIQHDFSNDFKNSTEYQQYQKHHLLNEPIEEYSKPSDFKDKYLQLLEDQNKFLREKSLTQESLLLAIDKLINSLNPKKSLDGLGDDLKASMNKNTANISDKLEMIAQAIMSH